MNAAKENEEIKNSFKAFKIKYEDLVKVYEELPTRYKQAFNDIISKINILHDDTSRKSIDKFVDAVSDLGKIARNEVITPEPVVEKMINKLKKEDFENAETILLVNEKYGEFFKYIAEHFGKTIAKKCRIVPSSEIGVMLTKKLLNSFGLNKYINTIILDIGDVDENGQYDVKDFLELMKNKEELEKKTGVKRFSVCVMNPPYSSIENGASLDIKFLDEVTNISDRVISIQPAKMASKMKIYRRYFDRKHIKSIELISPKDAFGIASLGSWKYVGIYDIDSNNTYDNIIFYIDNDEKNIKNDESSLIEFVESFDTSKQKIKKLAKKYENLYNDLLQRYKSLTVDNDDFIYEENHPPRGYAAKVIKKTYQTKLNRVKEYLKSGKYKYCIYKGSFNNDIVKEWDGSDPDKIFKGQICWLTNKENVKNNLLYWLNCPLFNMWRETYLDRCANCYIYNLLPSLNFNKNEKDFKEYVDSLAKFDNEDIKILKEYNIKNHDKL